MEYNDQAITTVAYLMQQAYLESPNQAVAVKKVQDQISDEWREEYGDSLFLNGMWQAIDAYVDINVNYG